MILLVIGPTAAWAQSQLELTAESVELIYDSSTLPVTEKEGILLMDRLEGELKLLEKTSSAESPKAEAKRFYLVPVAPEKIKDLEMFSSLSESDAKVFLVKKQKFLEGFSHILKTLRFPFSLHNKAINLLNNQFFKAARTIAYTNSRGGYLRLQLGGGLGISKELAKRFGSFAESKWFPKAGGFYFSVGAGIGLRKAAPEEGGRWSFNVFVSYETLRKVDTFLATVGLDGSLSYFEQNTRMTKRVQDIGIHVLGPAGTIRLSDHFFSYGMAGGPTFPPLADKLMLYSLNDKQITLLDVHFNPIGSWFVKFGAMSCGKVFQ